MNHIECSCSPRTQAASSPHPNPTRHPIRHSAGGQSRTAAWPKVRKLQAQNVPYANITTPTPPPHTLHQAWVEIAQQQQHRQQQWQQQQPQQQQLQDITAIPAAVIQPATATGQQQQQPQRQQQPAEAVQAALKRERVARHTQTASAARVKKAAELRSLEAEGGAEADEDVEFLNMFDVITEAPPKPEKLAAKIGAITFNNVPMQVERDEQELEVDEGYVYDIYYVDQQFAMDDE